MLRSLSALLVVFSLTGCQTDGEPPIEEAPPDTAAVASDANGHDESS